MFASARLKLTLWYLTSILCISVFFSAVIYHVLSLEVERFERIQRFRIERRIQNDTSPIVHRQVGLPPPPIDIELLSETRHRILLMLILVNLGIASASAFFGFMLSGRTLRPIQIMMDEQDRFVGDASHEFRTPLASLLTSFEVYLRSTNRTRKEADILVTESIGEVLRLKSLSESLLTLARYKYTNNEAARQDVQIKEIILKAINAVSQLARKKQIHIVQKGVNVTLHCGYESIVELFVILLDNAIKFSEEKTTITIVTHKKDPYVEISVADQGIGIQPENLQHIFDRFYQTDPSRSRKSEGGYGLGLAIAKDIVKQHHGSIIVTSTVQKGSTFTVTLPMGVYG